MADHFRTLQQFEFVHKHLASNTRPDGRSFYQDRELLLDAGSISTASATSIIKLGSTTVLCGLMVNLVDRISVEKQFEQQNQSRPSVLFDQKPKSTLDSGSAERLRVPARELRSILLQVQVKVKPYSTYAIRMDSRDGECKENGLLASQIKQSILEGNFFADEHFEAAGNSEQLLHYDIEIMILNHDGNILDASLVALVTAASKFQAPKELAGICRFKLTRCPVSSTFALMRFENRIISLLDPTLEEQQLADGSCSFVMDPENEQLLYTNFNVLCPGLDDKRFLELIDHSLERARRIKKKLSNF